MRGLIMRWHRKKPPVEFVYHAAAACTAESIEMDGIINWGTGIYVTTTPEDALRLTAWKLFDHAHQEGVVAHDTVIVWKIAVGLLSGDGRWSKGTDHSELLDVDSWVYSGSIPYWALLGATAYLRPALDSVGE
jgi:hypothetical protein